MSAPRAREILAAIKAGTYRFAPVLDRPDGTASWPPGWRPAPWQPRYQTTPAQRAAMKENLARGRAAANELQHAAGPLSKQRRA